MVVRTCTMRNHTRAVVVAAGRAGAVYPSMTKGQQIARIRKACIAIKPEILEHHCGRHKKLIDLNCALCVICKIRLADILAALREKNRSLGIDIDGLFIIPTAATQPYRWDPADPRCPVWDIYQDDLERQKDVCVDFIYSRLRA